MKVYTVQDDGGGCPYAVFSNKDDADAYADYHNFWIEEFTLDGEPVPEPGGEKKVISFMIDGTITGIELSYATGEQCDKRVVRGFCNGINTIHCFCRDEAHAREIVDEWLRNNVKPTNA